MTQTTETAQPTIHAVRRGTYNVGGFTSADRTGGHVDRVRVYRDQTIRLMVEGQKSVGFGLGAVDADLHYNLGERQGTAPGPDVYTYGLAGVIDNHGGSRREIDEARDNGLLIEARVGDYLAVDGRLWRIDWAGTAAHPDRYNVTLTLAFDGTTAR